MSEEEKKNTEIHKDIIDVKLSQKKKDIDYGYLIEILGTWFMIL